MVPPVGISSHPCRWQGSPGAIGEEPLGREDCGGEDREGQLGVARTARNCALAQFTRSTRNQRFYTYACAPLSLTM